jgi:hypothetical protein
MHVGRYARWPPAAHHTAPSALMQHMPGALTLGAVALPLDIGVTSFVATSCGLLVYHSVLVLPASTASGTHPLAPGCAAAQEARTLYLRVCRRVAGTGRPRT